MNSNLTRTLAAFSAIATLATAVSAGEVPVNLRSAGNFAVLASSTVTNVPGIGTHLVGDLGVSPGTEVQGFPPGTLTGTIHAGDATAAQAQLDLTTAYNDAAGRSTGVTTVSGNLGGMTLTPGVYKSTSSLGITTGQLTLDAQGDQNAVFIIQMASTLTVGPGAQVVLSGGALPSKVFWQVGSSATFETTSSFQGVILAQVSITFNSGATLNGKALARTGGVTLGGGNSVGGPSPSASVDWSLYE